MSHQPQPEGTSSRPLDQPVAAGSQTVDNKTLRKVTIASLMGTMLEYYDHFIFGTASALVFPFVFFTQMPPSIALLLSLVTYGVAFIARPLGALIFGHYGDRIGRKNTLVAAMALMGVATFLIGLLPSYATAGIFGAIALAILRLTQGIAIGGEWGGAAIMVNEYAKGTGKRGFLGSMVQIASPLGFLLAGGIFAIIQGTTTNKQFLAWGWRIPFLVSLVLVIVGLWMRSSLEESPEFVDVMSKKDEDEVGKAPVTVVFRDHRRNLLLAIGTRIGSDTAFYFFALFPLVYLPMIGVDRQVALYAQIAASIGQAIGVPIFGRMVDKIGSRLVLIYGGIANTIYVFVFIFLLDLKNPPVAIVAGFIGLFALAALWAPLASHMPAMFPVEVRFTGAGFGFQAAGILGNAIAPTIILLMLTRFNSGYPVAVYLAFTLVLGVVCVILTRLYDTDDVVVAEA